MVVMSFTRLHNFDRVPMSVEPAVIAYIQLKVNPMTGKRYIELGDAVFKNLNELRRAAGTEDNIAKVSIPSSIEVLWVNDGETVGYINKLPENREYNHRLYLP